MARKRIRVGCVSIGGGAPVSVQSMTTTDTRDVAGTASQIRRLADAGCELVRVAVPDMAAARAVGQLKNRVPVPIVADIHFDYKLAVTAAEAGADKIRINPGNIGGDTNVRAVTEACRRKGIPIRIGVNGGSLEKDILAKYGGVTPEALLESALRHVRLLNRFDFDDICISVKSSDTALTIDSYRLLARETDYPLHLGVTEAGTEYMGIVKSAVGIGSSGRRDRRHPPRLSDRPAGAGGQGGPCHPPGLGAAPRGAGADLVSDVRALPDRPDRHRQRGRKTAGGDRARHDRRGHGLRGQRAGRGAARRLRNRRRRRRGRAL